MKAGTIIERHQLAGVDDRERGFSRLVDAEQTDGMFQASLQYEETRVISGRCETTTAAVVELARLLQDRGYSQLRTQLNFRGARISGHRNCGWNIQTRSGSRQGASLPPDSWGLCAGSSRGCVQGNRS